MRKEMKKPIPEINQVYGVPLRNNQVGVVHLCYVEKIGRGAYAVVAGFFPWSFPDLDTLKSRLEDLDFSDPFAVISITKSVIREGEWKLAGTKKAVYRNLHVESRIDGVLRLFDGFEMDPDWILDMYHGCAPWDGFYDPLYLDKLLLPGKTRPESAKLKSEFTRDELIGMGYRVD